jgi:hypothetical protein
MDEIPVPDPGDGDRGIDRPVRLGPRLSHVHERIRSLVLYDGPLRAVTATTGEQDDGERQNHEKAVHRE